MKLIRIKRGELDRAFNRAYRYCLNGIKREENSLMAPYRLTLFQKDLAFFVMFFSGVYKLSNNAPEKIRKKTLINKATVYAANMDVIISYLLAKSRSPIKARLFPKRAIRLVSLYYPGKVTRLESLIAELDTEIENLSRDPEMLAGIVGRIYQEVFSWREDKYTEDIRSFAYYLGKYFYLSKLYTELKTDEKKGNYNPLVFLKKNDPQSFDTYMKQTLKSLSNACMEAFHRIPIRENETILYHALNAGVWSQ